MILIYKRIGTNCVILMLRTCHLGASAMETLQYSIKICRHWKRIAYSAKPRLELIGLHDALNGGSWYGTADSPMDDAPHGGISEGNLQFTQ
ncbi:hypothetical protein FPOAC1_005774 [Fusarium poae]|uniref:hypothetical protein n=1 Tax=Fusarium poae TaxID=36050 RepID=UPI001CEBD0C2|nr:hypothetical protein FPOAC1_005774 [Fusarium poae]KAG8672498.1 hypothetical protein FPOAC1_005774 [Fusarium poae]